MRLLLAFALISTAARAQDPVEVLTRNAGYETGQRLVGQDATFSFERLRAGFDRGIRGDSAEGDFALGLRAGFDTRSETDVMSPAEVASRSERFRAGFVRGVRGDSAEVAYALGLRAGLGLRADTTSGIDPALFLASLQAGLRGDAAPYTAEEVQRAMAAYLDDLALRQLRAQAGTNLEARRRLAEIPRNREASARFLAEVERRPGVQKTASGMLYRVRRDGRGARPTMNDQVEIRYVGRLADGTEFDRSQGDEPTTLPVSAVVPGFAEALVMMRPGEEMTVWIPPSLAYGLQGAPGPNGEGGIPPNAALEFDLTLVRVVPAGDSFDEDMYPPPPPPPPPPPVRRP